MKKKPRIVRPYQKKRGIMPIVRVAVPSLALLGFLALCKYSLETAPEREHGYTAVERQQLANLLTTLSPSKPDTNGGGKETTPIKGDGGEPKMTEEQAALMVYLYADDGRRL